MDTIRRTKIGCFLPRSPWDGCNVAARSCGCDGRHSAYGSWLDGEERSIMQEPVEELGSLTDRQGWEWSSLFGDRSGGGAQATNEKRSLGGWSSRSVGLSGYHALGHGHYYSALFQRLKTIRTL